MSWGHITFTIRVLAAPTADARGARRVLPCSSGQHFGVRVRPLAPALRVGCNARWPALSSEGTSRRQFQPRARGLSSPRTARASSDQSSRPIATRTGPGGYGLPAQNPDHERRANDLMPSCHLQKPRPAIRVSCRQGSISGREDNSLNQPHYQFVVLVPSALHLRASKAAAAGPATRLRGETCN